MLPFVVGLAVVLAMAYGGLCVWRRGSRRTSGWDNRYALEPILTTEEVHVLDYLQDTFPGQVVLPRVRLSRMLSVRKTTNQNRARAWLRQESVDFVVCGEDGRPSFAFDVEQHHLSNANAKARRLKMKNRMLRAAGVRLILLKNGLHRMPPPEEFRQQLKLAALPLPPAKGRESALQQLERQFSRSDPAGSAPGHRRSELMGRSSLMGLEQETGARRQLKDRRSRSLSR